MEDIIKTYGGGPRYYRGYSSSTNAYMLMYRQIDKQRNTTAITEDQFPPHIQKLLKEIQESEENERAIKAREEEMIKVKVYTNPNLSAVSQTKLYCLDDTTLTDALQMAYQNLQLEKVVPIEQCRLVSYNHAEDQKDVSFEGREKETVKEILSSLKFYFNYELFLETREKNQVFIPYNMGDITLTVYRIDVENEEVLSAHNLRTSPCQCLPDLRQFLCTVIPLPNDNIHIVLCKPTTLVYMSDDSLPLNKLGFYSTNRVFICPREAEMDSNTFQQSKLKLFIEKIQNVIILNFKMPDVSPETLERMMIPPLNETKLNGNNNRQMESIPTDKGMALPLNMTNGIEEEGLCGGGAGGTSDQSTSEDSSLTDSERTIVGDVPNEGQLSSPSDSEQQLSSPESHTQFKINDVNFEENWEEEETVNKFCYFSATPYTAGSERMLRVVVDKIIDLSILRKKLEPYVGVAAKYIELYKRFIDRFEVFNSLSSFKDEEKIDVILQLVLNDGEDIVKLHLLQINATKPIQYLCDWIVMKSSTVGATKKVMLKELEKRNYIKIPYERCRLWRRHWKSQNSIGKVLLDTQVWEEDCMTGQNEILIQELESPETITRSNQYVMFTRQYHPSSFTLDPFKEIVLEGSLTADFPKKLSEIIDIPVEHIEFARFTSLVLTEVSVYNLHSEFEWDHSVNFLLLDWSFIIPTEDIIAVYYRDDREELKTMTQECVSQDEQQDARNREPRVNSSSHIYSHIRKEKALKIYRDLSPKTPVLDKYD